MTPCNTSNIPSRRSCSYFLCLLLVFSIQDNFQSTLEKESIKHRLLVSPLIKCAEDNQKPKGKLTQKMKKRYAFKHKKITTNKKTRTAR